jgi:hypothetical protein
MYLRVYWDYQFVRSAPEKTCKLLSLLCHFQVWYVGVHDTDEGTALHLDCDGDLIDRLIGALNANGFADWKKYIYTDSEGGECYFFNPPYE